MSTLRDLQSQADSDVIAQANANAAKVAADAAVAKSTPIFAAALKGEPGGFAIDDKVTPFAIYSTTDGLTYTKGTASSLDDAVVDPTVAPTS